METPYGPRTFALADRNSPSDHLIDLALRRFALDASVGDCLSSGSMDVLMTGPGRLLEGGSLRALLLIGVFQKSAEVE